MTSENPLLRRAYSLDGDADEIRRVYADWAESYDQDTASEMGYVAPGLAAAVLGESVAKDGAILDVGCGTGLAGDELHRLGYQTIDGLDLSQEMLDIARRKAVYRSLDVADILQGLNVADNTYDGVISVGVFTSGHVGPKALDELARVARPGGSIIVTVHEMVWEKDGYLTHLEGMDHRKLAIIRDIKDSRYHDKAGYRCRLCVLTAT